MSLPKDSLEPVAFGEAPIAGLAGVVLCGGESSRMGRPKAWLPFGTEPLLERIVRRVAKVVSPVLVVAAPGQPLPELPMGARAVFDPVTGEGPLRGIHTAFSALPGDTRAFFACSVDLPFLHPSVIRRLVDLRGHRLAEGESYEMVIPEVRGHLHPLCAVYSRSLEPLVASLLDEGTRRLSIVHERARSLVVDEPLLRAGESVQRDDPELRSFRNVNTPEDYETALFEERAQVER